MYAIRSYYGHRARWILAPATRIRRRQELFDLDLADLSPREVKGMTYNPFTRVYRLGSDCDVNYLLHCTLSS